MKPMRRVVTGNDAQGRSTVLWDSDAHNVRPSANYPDSGMVEMWAWEQCPAPISGGEDSGRLAFHHFAPEQGGFLRMVQSAGRARNYDPAKDPAAEPLRETRKRAGGNSWDRGGHNAFSTPVHKTQTTDYGIVIEGARTLLLDDREIVMRRGEVVVQLANWHGWSNPESDSVMAFIMMGSRLDE
jgi:hypothetical protein